MSIADPPPSASMAMQFVAKPQPAVSDEDRAVDELLAKHGTAPEKLLPVLQALQAQFRHLPAPALQRYCQVTGIAPATVMGVATFYDQFRLDPAGEHMVSICTGTACYVKGAKLVMEALERELGVAPGQDTSPDGKYTIQEVACVGCCSIAPVVGVDEEIFGPVRADRVGPMIETYHELAAAGRRELPEIVGSGPIQGELWCGLDSCCVARGSEKVRQALYDALIQTGVSVRIKHVSCVGICYLTPMVEVVKPGEEPIRYGPLKPEDCLPLVRKHFAPKNRFWQAIDRMAGMLDNLLTDEGSQPVERYAVDHRDPQVASFYGPQVLIATEHSGHQDPLDLDEYRAHEGFVALEKVVNELTPDEIIDWVERSGLRGRGGGGFPTARKWRFVAGYEADQKYIICNGDEGDPGAFMDRMLLESYPYRVYEGMAIAARAIGATKGYLYIRAEYPLAVKRMGQMLEKVREANLLGKQILGTDFDLELEIVQGAGAYVCGEETAMLESIEGRRGVPRLRPPYPAQHGLWGKPTLVNNVETYANLPWIFRHGAEKFAAMGTERSKGTKVFSLTGQVQQGGLIEVPMGISLREIVNEVGGGVPEGRTFKAVQIGGPSGGLVPEHLLDTPVDYEALKEVGAIMGSGGLVVLDDTSCMVDIAIYFLKFTQEQSCGKCTPCRAGTRRMLEVMERICTGKGKKSDIPLLQELAGVVQAGSMCGLGVMAPNPVLSAIRHFIDEFEAHINGYCPAGVCKELIHYGIDGTCIGCTRCAQYCPTDAIPMRPFQLHSIIQDKCIKCDMCRVVCPVESVKVFS